MLIHVFIYFSSSIYVCPEIHQKRSRHGGSAIHSRKCLRHATCCQIWQPRTASFNASATHKGTSRANFGVTEPNTGLETLKLKTTATKCSDGSSHSISG